jgi:hypothetical protein
LYQFTVPFSVKKLKEASLHLLSDFDRVMSETELRIPNSILQEGRRRTSRGLPVREHLSPLRYGMNDDNQVVLNKIKNIALGNFLEMLIEHHCEEADEIFDLDPFSFAQLEMDANDRLFRKTYMKMREEGGGGGRVSGESEDGSEGNATSAPSPSRSSWSFAFRDLDTEVLSDGLNESGDFDAANIINSRIVFDEPKHFIDSSRGNVGYLDSYLAKKESRRNRDNSTDYMIDAYANGGVSASSSSSSSS